MVQSSSVVNAPLGVAGVNIVRMGLLWVLSLAPALGFAQGLFPTEEAPLLGGREWERRISAELRVGLDSGALGGLGRFYLGPNLGLEVEVTEPVDLGFGSQAESEAQGSWSIRSPFRISLSELFFWAPFVSYRRNSSGKNLWPAGFETWTRIGPVDLWIEAAAYVGESSVSGQWSVQLEKSFSVGARVASFLGLRYTQEILSGVENGGLFLVSGSRF